MSIVGRVYLLGLGGAVIKSGIGAMCCSLGFAIFGYIKDCDHIVRAIFAVLQKLSNLCGKVLDVFGEGV